MAAYAVPRQTRSNPPTPHFHALACKQFFSDKCSRKHRRKDAALKPKLLIVELWGLGDLVIATPFLRAAAGKFDVTLLAKPYALDLQPRLWPGVRVETFNAPWTVFKNKYHFWRWPILKIVRLRRRLVAGHFEFGVSTHSVGDPRDHLLLKI